MESYINGKGEVVFKGKNAFGRAARKVFDARWGGGESHMRMGRFSVIVSPEMGHDYEKNCSLNELLVAETYDSNRVEGDGSIPPGSKYWESHKSDRLNQIGVVLSRLYRKHVMHEELMKDIRLELLYLLEAK